MHGEMGEKSGNCLDEKEDPLRWAGSGWKILKPVFCIMNLGSHSYWKWQMMLDDFLTNFFFDDFRKKSFFARDPIIKWKFLFDDFFLQKKVFFDDFAQNKFLFDDFSLKKTFFLHNVKKKSFFLSFKKSSNIFFWISARSSNWNLYLMIIARKFMSYIFITDIGGVQHQGGGGPTSRGGGVQHRGWGGL